VVVDRGCLKLALGRLCMSKDMAKVPAGYALSPPASPAAHPASYTRGGKQWGTPLLQGPQRPGPAGAPSPLWRRLSAMQAVLHSRCHLLCVT
jgi:hypothetical protein